MNEDVEDVVASVIARHPFEGRPPWSPRDDEGVAGELQRVVAALAAELDVEVRAEFGHYGSGYASFVDAWFFRREAAFRKTTGAEHFTGLVVVFCRLAPLYCLLEGERAWTPSGSSSYLPAFEGVDAFSTGAVQRLSREVQDRLGPRGYVRLERATVSDLLPEGIAVPTILTDGPYREFDALFHWVD